ncbi:MAG: hypothetical protein KZQ89_02080 [Candidatus Thiodiazotropha sp. (ex Lucinoma kastoroae)]|nr:hypothetical protein [Candidatus Thiodiazotropha sp. (ex Lucinoma kastoroae)]
MQILITVLLWLTPASLLLAEPWQFEHAVNVTHAKSSTTHNIFHHLDSSGRRNIATSTQGVAVTWEDDRDDTPRIYLAFKPDNEDSFKYEVKISGEGEAFEPSLVALANNRFVVAWEENSRIFARMVEFNRELRLGPTSKLNKGTAAQVSLTQHKDSLFALWSERMGRYGQIRSQRLSVNTDGVLEPGTSCPADTVPPTDEQLYPSAVVTDNRLVVAWEDRRPKHTIIMAAAELRGEPCHFSEPIRISDKPESRNLPYGAGHGVSRVALGRFGSEGVFAAWADKRDFRDGYDIWGADFSLSKGEFGTNEKVQDDFGGLSKQRHATVGGHAKGMLVVAWDDEREGNADIMLSWRENGEWSEDWSLPVASGLGQQSNPSIVLDSEGNLHIAWVERNAIGATTRLKYAFGKLQADPGL